MFEVGKITQRARNGVYIVVDHTRDGLPVAREMLREKLTNRRPALIFVDPGRCPVADGNDADSRYGVMTARR